MSSNAKEEAEELPVSVDVVTKPNKWLAAIGKVSSTLEDENDESCTIDKRLVRSGSSLTFFEDMSQGKYDQWDPELCVQLLRLPSVHNYSGMKKWLENSNEERLSDFLELDGLSVLFESLEKLCDKGFSSFADAVTQLECVSCIRTVMNLNIGLDYIVRHPECTRKLANALETKNTLVKKQVFELLSAVSISCNDGHRATIDALESYKVAKRLRFRFGFIVDEIRTTDVVPYKATLLGFVNCLIVFPDDLKTRIRIRNEFLGLGLADVVGELRNEDDGGVAIQCDAFDRDRVADEEEAETEGIDLNADVHCLFESILSSVRGTPNEFSLTNILGNLKAMNSTHSSDELWAALEAMTEAAVVGKLSAVRKNTSGSLTKDETTQTRSRVKNLKCSKAIAALEMSSKLEEIDAIESGRDCCGDEEAAFSTSPELNLDKRCFDLHLNDTVTKLSNPVTLSSSSISASVLPVSLEILSAEINSSSAPVASKPRIPPPPPMPSGALTGPISVPPTLSPTAGSIPPPPPLPGSLSGPIPPPPPPPPPCSTMIGHFSELIRQPSQKMKTLSWSKLTPQAVEFTEKSIWGSLNRKKSDKPRRLNLEEMEQLFCRNDAKKTAESTVKTRKMKMEVSLLEAKKSLAINIFLAQFKDVSEMIVKIAECDSNFFGLDKLIRLDKIVPQKGELEIIKSYSGDINSLGSAERFCLQLSDIESFDVRLRGMLISEEVPTVVSDLQNQLNVLTEAANFLLCDEHFADFLSLVLDTGNFLNAGSYAGNAAGFQLNTLSRLQDTKSNKRGVTLLHYLVMTAEKQDEKMLSFALDVSVINRASRFSIEEIHDEMIKISRSVQKFKEELRSSPKSVGDKFATFINESDESLKNFESSFKRTTDAANRLAAYFCEEEKDFKLKDCFEQLVLFCERIINAKRENEQRSKLEAKVRLAKEEGMKFKSQRLNRTYIDGARGGGGEKECLIDKLLGEIKRGSFKLRKLKRNI